MSVLNWGNPKIEIASGATAAAEGATYTEIAKGLIKQDSAKLDTTDGDTKEALNEGGETVDKRVLASKYSFTFQVFVTDSFTDPITDVNGVVTANHSVRLTPEDTTKKGFKMPYCSVSKKTTWSSSDGSLIEFTFTGLKPTTGNILQAYTQA